MSFLPYPIRIPNLPIGQMVDKEGYPTQQELTFRQTLLTNLNNIVGAQGLVASPQPFVNIQAIVANIAPDPVTGQVPLSGGQYTCPGGAFFYDTTNDRVLVTTLSSGVPILNLVTYTPI